ncbi:MAG: DUF2723 domain-containing protein [Deltaproteobacteria bacterium]|nr:DUF2723 domain-containing protein [Deltaproteobacteria bacterium]MDQ3300964.1 DUF2723 domain-containing protein [Myxococcota bacterium]
MRGFRDVMLERGGLIGLACFVLYAWLAPVHVVDGENAEFSTLAALGGAAHPSGYPLYVLWLRAMSWLPAASPAHAAGLATAILGAVQLVVLHAACRAWGARPAAASIAVMLFACAPTVLVMYTEAEVFALNGLVVATVLWLAASAGPLKGAWRCAALGLVAGLGIANHMTCTLVAPVGLLGVLRGLRETSGAKPVAGALALGGLIVGLTPYLYLLVAPVHQGTWGHITSFDDVVHTLLRRDYGGPVAFAGPGEAVPFATSLGALGRSVGRAWLWGPALLGLAMLGERSLRARAGEPRWGWRMLALSFVVAGPLLVLRFNIDPVGVGLGVVNRFHLLPALLLVVPVAAGIDRIARVALRDRALPLRAWSQAALICVGIAAVASLSLDHVRRIHSPALELQARNILRSLPTDAVLLAGTDDIGGGVNYVQLVRGERPDVLYVHWPLMALDWYRARIAARGLTLDLGLPGSPSVRFAEAALAQGRPVVVDHGQANIFAKLPSYPFGPMMRVLPRGATPPSLDEVVTLNKEIYARFDLGYEPPRVGDEWPADIHFKYAWTWNYLGERLRRAGRAEQAAAVLEVARSLGPQP